MKIALLGVAVCALIAGSADAAIVDITYTGTVTSGFDTTGVFGSSSTDLTGKSFELTFTYDTSIGIGAGTNNIYGGDGWSDPSPSLGAYLLVGTTRGHTIPGDFYSSVGAGVSHGQASTFQSITDRSEYPLLGGPTYFVTENDLNAGTDGARGVLPTLYTPYQADLTRTRFPNTGNFAIHTYYRDPVSGIANHEQASGSLLFTSVTQVVDGVLPAATAVPEPASWSLMLVGFGAVDYATRRNRKPAVSFS